MISNLKIYILEIIVAISLCGLVFLINSFFEEHEAIIAGICADCFQLNLAVTSAFIIALVAGKAFKCRGKNLKRIAKGSTTLLLINSAIMIGYRAIGVHGLELVVAATVGNVVKFWSISKNILEVV